MYDMIKQQFSACFGRPARFIFSAPGRTELGGNHTDHQLGRVLAGAVSVDTLAAVAPNAEPVIRVQSEGYPLCTVSLADLSIRTEDFGSTLSLIRGVADGIARLGHSVTGFDAYVSSRVLPGSTREETKASKPETLCPRAVMRPATPRIRLRVLPNSASLGVSFFSATVQRG